MYVAIKNIFGILEDSLRRVGEDDLTFCTAATNQITVVFHIIHAGKRMFKITEHPDLGRLFDEAMKAILPTGIHAEKTSFALDKLTKQIFDGSELNDDYQTCDVTPQRCQDQKIHVFYEFTLPKDVSVSVSLMPFDKLIYMVMYALWEAGNKLISYNQIANHITGKKPSSKQIARIAKSVEKMAAIRFRMSSEQEQGITSYPPVTIETRRYILPCEITEVSIRGRLTGAIRLLPQDKQFPLMEYAKTHKQVTTIATSLLRGGTLSDRGIRILFYRYLHLSVL